MAFSHHHRTLLAGIPLALPPHDQALSWAYAVCFHTVALAVASVTLRELPKAPTPAPVYRMEFLLSNPQNEADQAAPSDPQGASDPVTPQGTTALAEDVSPVVPSPSPSIHSTSSEIMKQDALSKPPIVKQTVQHPTPATRVPQPTDVSSVASDPSPSRSPMPIERQSETMARVDDSYQAASAFPSEAIEHSEIIAAAQTAARPSAEMISTNFHEEAELSSHVPPELSQNPVEAIADVAPTSATVPRSTPSGESSSPPTDPAAVITSQTEPSGSSDPSLIEPVAMNHPTLTRSAPTKPHYGWLMELLRRRIVSLQAYPSLARIQGWEGVVVVKTIINRDGSLVEAVVMKSSGYSALDEDALKLMHRVCPVHLPQDLGKSTIAVLVPIHYKLDRFE